ncbi:tRNA (adenosine(37)-N6)-dimethylallyltransferase MiaA [Halalkalibacillus sediminis]|uniref:tRNA dimethylallyltransferase n=1 Tax=Halalkalibacillus sediminis TaxID=2018042 RepID=A0A2I0QWG8_9BACI|nr:tRNA (adenosine(37)-N6)-dimethylallyltransferase MiaA [Halalkalibacillus sediminis]PKR78697.1 tRNA (adenosine(37)-N6)-dimethylallyltransferase MiaA [Halalkalibacillus sediminis]
MKPIVVSIIGPTAVGKSALGIELAKKFDGEVINGDSMQIYKEFDIGTAKVTEEEMDGVPHHLLDFLDPSESYSAADFKKDLKEKVEDIVGRNKLPIVVGGTGFYIHSALFDFTFSDSKRDDSFEKEMLDHVEQNGIEPYFEKLKSIDPDYAEKIHPHNIRRVIRALEVYERSGQTMTSIEENQEAHSPFRPIIIGLEIERETLYDRINNRVKDMMDSGLLAEVESVYKKYGKDAQGMQAIGYKEFIPYFDGEYELDEAIRLVQRNTRRFAKRQLTYYRNKLPDVHWYNIDPENYRKDFSTIFSDLEGMLKSLENSNQ